MDLHSLLQGQLYLSFTCNIYLEVTTYTVSYSINAYSIQFCKTASVV
jgi:hypothetical protein